jgi:hypothetical protein
VAGEATFFHRTVLEFCLRRSIPYFFVAVGAEKPAVFKGKLGVVAVGAVYDIPGVFYPGDKRWPSMDGLLPNHWTHFDLVLCPFTGIDSKGGNFGKIRSMGEEEPRSDRLAFFPTDDR